MRVGCAEWSQYVSGRLAENNERNRNYLLGLSDVPKSQRLEGDVREDGEKIEEKEKE